MHLSPIDICLAPADARGVRIAADVFQRLRLTNTVRAVPDTTEIISSLRRSSGPEESGRAGLILLDVPGIDEEHILELVAEIKGPALEATSLGLMVDAEHHASLLEAHGDTLARFVPKPIDLEALVQLVDECVLSWAMVAPSQADTETVEALEVLLVEDSKVDAMLTTRIMAQSRWINEVHWVNDGEIAMTYLLQQGVFHNARTPGLVLLDINMPKMNGFELLTEMNCDPGLQHIPVAMLSVSESEEDLQTADRLGARCFLAKPLKLIKLLANTPRIGCHWAILREA